MCVCAKDRTCTSHKSRNCSFDNFSFCTASGSLEDDSHTRYSRCTGNTVSIRFETEARELTVVEIEGSVVRVAPNELSFNAAQSWKDIYEPRQGHGLFLKSEFYEGGSFANLCGSIVSERDPAKHGAMKKELSQAFSMRSLAEQEHLIASLVDQLVEELRKRGGESLDLGQWFNMMTFDIIGDLAFGETFGGVASGKDVPGIPLLQLTHGLSKTGKTHPWILRLEGALTQGALADCFKRFPLIAKAIMILVPGTIRQIVADTKTNEEYSINLIRKRIARKTDRRDFLTRILQNGGQDKGFDIQIAAHASDFVLAGSETVTTALSCASYYILRIPQVKESLQHEIRKAFDSYESINAASTSSLKYLNAVLLESLRIYPPLPFALPRIVPEGGSTVDGYRLPANVSIISEPTINALS
jgi:cytochrome P450